MADEKVNENGGGAAPNNTTPSTPNGTDPSKTGMDASGSAVDPTKFSDKDWETIYSNPKLYEHPRFKGLNERAQLAKQLEAEKAEAEKSRLVEEKKYQELAELNKKEAETWKSKAESAVIDNSIAFEAQKLGVVDIEAVTKLINRKEIKLGDDGSATGVVEAVKALVDSKPYLVGKQKDITIGSGTNPGSNNNATVQKFKLSQLQDHKFFMYHQKEIDQAIKICNIENYMAKGI